MGRAEPPITIAVLAQHPPLLKPFLGWAAALAVSGLLSKRDHELLALRAAFNCLSDFEWDEHTNFARDAGITDQEISRVITGPNAPGWSRKERVLLTAADELHSGARITDETKAHLAEHLDPAQIVELVYVVGQYTMLSYVANTFGD